MYSFGKKKHIQTTQETIDLIEHEFNYKVRDDEIARANGGKIQVKGKGLMEVFFILGPKDVTKDMYQQTSKEKTATIKQKGMGVKENVIKRNRKSMVAKNQNAGGFSAFAHMDPEKLITHLLNNNETFETKDKQEQANRALLGLRINKDDWNADGDHKNCEQCDLPFTFTFRRHHCRFCGRLLCNNCTKKRLENQRICDQCQEVYLHVEDQSEWLKQIKDKEREDDRKKASEDFVRMRKKKIHTTPQTYLLFLFVFQSLFSFFFLTK